MGRVTYFIPWIHTGTCISSLWRWAGWPILFCGSTQEPASVVCDDGQGDLFYSVDPHRNLHQPQLTREKLGRSFGEKNEGEWIGKVEFRKKEIPGSKWRMRAVIWPTTSFKGRTFQIWILNWRVLNFCVRSTPLCGHLQGMPSWSGTSVLVLQVQLQSRLPAVRECFWQYTSTAYQ